MPTCPDMLRQTASLAAEEQPSNSFEPDEVCFLRLPAQDHHHLSPFDTLEIVPGIRSKGRSPVVG